MKQQRPKNQETATAQELNPRMVQDVLGPDLFPESMMWARSFEHGQDQNKYFLCQCRDILRQNWHGILFEMIHFCHRVHLSWLKSIWQRPTCLNLTSLTVTWLIALAVWQFCHTPTSSRQDLYFGDPLNQDVPVSVRALCSVVCCIARVT